jgi:hypothetical protein
VAAKSVLLQFYTLGGFSEPALRIEPRWWDADEVSRDPRFVISNDTGSYSDWNADLTDAEFQAMHDHFRSQATVGIYQSDDWQRVIRPQLQVIDGVLSGALGSISKVNVTVFEWESGL